MAGVLHMSTQGKVYVSESLALNVNIPETVTDPTAESWADWNPTKMRNYADLRYEVRTKTFPSNSCIYSLNR
jgi:hypothetical protein